MLAGLGMLTSIMITDIDVMQQQRRSRSGTTEHYPVQSNYSGLDQVDTSSTPRMLLDANPDVAGVNQWTGSRLFSRELLLSKDGPAKLSLRTEKPPLHSRTSHPGQYGGRLCRRGQW